MISYPKYSVFIGETVYLCGDFSIDLLKHKNNWDTNCCIDMLVSSGFYPTNITLNGGTLIDKIYNRVGTYY